MEELNNEKEELKEYKDELSNLRTDMMDYFEFKKKKELDQYKEEVEEERKSLKLERDQLRIQMKNVEQAIDFLDSSIFIVVRSSLVVAAPNKSSDVTMHNASRSSEQLYTNHIHNNGENQSVISSKYLGNHNLVSHLIQTGGTSIFEEMIFEVGKNVKLLGNGIPKRVVAYGVLISMTPEIVFGVPLGPDFWKI